MVDPLVLKNSLTGDELKVTHIVHEPYENQFALSIRSEKHGTAAILLTPDAMDRLNSYYWDSQLPYQKPDTESFKKQSYRKKRVAKKE